jgi:threonine aldolase
VDANMIFVRLPGSVISDLAKKYHFYIMDKKTNLSRLVTSFDTQKEEIDIFVKDIECLVD